MYHRWLATLAGAAFALLVPAAAAAQIDYRNLDDDRPTRTEDAYPLEHHAFELLLPLSYTAWRGGGTLHASVLELTYGALRDFQVGIKVPLAGQDPPGPGRTTWGVSGVRVFALYNFNTDGPLPALALRADVHIPAGSLGGDQARGELKGIVTRSFGRTRAHLNGALGLGAEGTQPAVEGAARWWAGGALDRTLFRQSVLLIAEAYAIRDTRGAALEVNAGLGARWQLSPTIVLDAGVTRRLRDTGPDLSLTLGLSHAFAVAGLMPVRRMTPAPAGGRDAHH